MSSYTIDFSDPLKAGFSIAAGGFNGPGGSAANTSLRLYGRGALEWGEAVDEDLVRLTENFASASPPSVAIPGQLWVEMSLYHRNTSIGNVLQGWYRYDINSVAANKWTLLNGTGVVAGVAPITPTIGEYYYDSGTGQLMGYYMLGRYEPAAWVTRSHTIGAGVPVSPTVTPKMNLRVRDSHSAQWTSPVVATYTSSTPASALHPGMLWWNPSTGNLSVWSGAEWQEILGPSGASQTTSSGQVNMNSFKIVGLADPDIATDAATKAYVDAVAGGVGGFLPLTGGTLSVTGTPGLVVDRTNNSVNAVVGYTTTSGSIYAGQGPAGMFAIDDDPNLSSAPWLTATATAVTVPGSLTTGTFVNVGGALTVGAGVTTTGGANIGTSLAVGTTASIGGTLNMTSHKIINLLTGTNANDAVNVAQMNAAIAAGGVGANTPEIWSSGTYKAGDIAISAGKIYMAVAGGTGGPPGGNWKQVFPAVYA